MAATFPILLSLPVTMNRPRRRRKAKSVLPPSLSVQPENQVADPGGSATFSVTAAGATPFSYQWRFNAGNIPGATSRTLTLNNVQYTNGGNYSVNVINVAGASASQPAELIV